MTKNHEQDKNWLEEGFKNIWLPYNQMQLAELPLPVVDAEGCKIKLADGRELVDGIASWWTACHGYKHPVITSAIKDQAEKLSHIMFGGLAHEPAYKLATKLAQIAPNGLNRVFFSDSGSTAVEVALKMAVQYWVNKGDKKKNRFICFKGGYHGDTMGAMSVSDPEQGMHKLFNSFMPMQYTVDIPSDEYGFADFKELVKGIRKNVAALIIEPLVQCAGGMKFHSTDVLAEIKKICKENEILFIADEIATGVGRTGMMFACQEAGVVPDIMCIGKALTGGTIGLAATLATDEIFSEFLSDKIETAFMHGPTYMANPLATAAALASVSLFEIEPRLKQVEELEKNLNSMLDRCRGLKNVREVRVKGGIGVVQLKECNYQKLLELRKAFVCEGAWIRPIENVIYLMPPFVISKDELLFLTDTIYKILEK